MIKLIYTTYPEVADTHFKKFKAKLGSIVVNTTITMERNGVIIDQLLGADTSYVASNIAHDVVIHPTVLLLCEAITGQTFENQNYEVLGLEPVTQGFQVFLSLGTKEVIDVNQYFYNRVVTYLRPLIAHSKVVGMSKNESIDQFVKKMAFGFAIADLIREGSTYDKIKARYHTIRTSEKITSLDWGEAIYFEESFEDFNPFVLPDLEQVQNLQDSILAEVDLDAMFKINPLFL
ncbi:MAG: hypothetical protein ACRCXZ_03645 [Patescibacteria group bacterium]